MAKNRSNRTLSGIIEFEKLEIFPNVKSLIDQCESKEFGKRSKIWVANEKVNTIYFLESGMVKEGIETVGGKEFIFDFHTGPGFAGLTHLFQNNFHSYCEVIETSIIKTISRKALEEIILHENLWTSFQNYFSALCQQHLARLAVNSFGNVREKVAFHLHSLSKKMNKQTIHLSREDLASYCGIAKETLIRNLTELKDDKIISIDQEGIHIKNLQKLNALFM
ncbi:MAG: Crp/Fnr family transcriptional regulator [Saprospiraceae bacterium]|nr:Crp/Fnr family transcriptional regulator [Saprospiraceae bacterium]